MSIPLNNMGPPPAGPPPPNKVVRPNGQAPRSMEELCQPSIDGRGGPCTNSISTVSYTLTVLTLDEDLFPTLCLSLFPYSLTHHATACGMNFYAKDTGRILRVDRDRPLNTTTMWDTDIQQLETRRLETISSTTIN
ncbi:hypothetical protein Tco_0184547 [Tanacetum coccineum]